MNFQKPSCLMRTSLWLNAETNRNKFFQTLSDLTKLFFTTFILETTHQIMSRSYQILSRQPPVIVRIERTHLSENIRLVSFKYIYCGTACSPSIKVSDVLQLVQINIYTKCEGLDRINRVSKSYNFSGILFLA